MPDQARAAMLYQEALDTLDLALAAVGQERMLLLQTAVRLHAESRSSMERAADDAD